MTATFSPFHVIIGSLTLVLSPHFKEPLINSLFWAYFFVKFFAFIRAILCHMWYNKRLFGDRSAKELLPLRRSAILSGAFFVS